MALCTLDVQHRKLVPIAGSLPSTATQDPLTLGAMSEDAWKEVRLPLGLKELLGSTKSKYIKICHQRRTRNSLFDKPFCEWQGT